MAEDLVKVLWKEDAFEERKTSQGGPLYLLVWASKLGCGIFGVPAHKYLGRPGNHIGDEIYHVLSGTLWVFFPDFHTIKRAEAGETIFMPARTTHAPYNDTGEMTWVLTCSAPLDPDADVHYTMDLADIIRFMSENKGQRDEEPRVLSVSDIAEQGRSSGSPTHELLVQGKHTAAGAFYLPPRKSFAGPIRRDADTVCYVMKGELTLVEEGSGGKTTAPQGKAVYLAPGATVTGRNEGDEELLVYYASALSS